MVVQLLIVIVTIRCRGYLVTMVTRSAMRQPFRAVMQHLGGSWDKRHAMRFYVLHVATQLCADPNSIGVKTLMIKLNR